MTKYRFPSRALVALLTCASNAEAREATLAQFHQPVQTIAAEGASEGSVGEALWSHLLGIGQTEQTFEHPPVGRRPWRESRAPQGTHGVHFQSALQYFSRNCVLEHYTPTWWLPIRVEVLRAAHFNTMASIACEFGIPTSLLDTVIAQESGYKSWTVSVAGAMGMMQIMPGTADVLGLRNPFDPISNMRAGARYLRQQLDRFGRVDLALAAYNAGPERRSLRAGYIPAIPETRNYVRTITTNWARLAQLGIETTDSEIRGNAAIMAVQASGYRSVELVRYDGSNAANPMQ